MSEPITVGLSAGTHGLLKALHDGGHFAEMADAYRLAVTYALAKHVSYADLGEPGRSTIFNTGSLDPERLLYSAVDALIPHPSDPVYRRIEKLAEWGVIQLHHRLVDLGESLSAIIVECSSEEN